MIGRWRKVAQNIQTLTITPYSNSFHNVLNDIKKFKIKINLINAAVIKAACCQVVVLH